jgi:hypothetical protein
MKICIITVYRSYNFGSFLQAYGLYEYLTSLGHDVVFYEGGLRKLSCLGKIKNIVLSNKSIINIFKGIVFELLEYKQLKKAWNKLPYTKVKENFDFVITGSDEIWNVSREECRFEEFFAKDFIGKKISYAPSINTATKEHFENTNYPILLNEYENISVRDEHSKNIIQKYTSKDISITVDPTFLIENKKIKNYKKEEYIAIYLFQNGINKEDINSIKQFAKNNNLKLVSVGQYISWCDECTHSIEGMPFYMYENAKYVITNTFHGTAYAINYRKQFVTFAKNKNKIKDLLNQFNLIERNINNKQLDEVLKKRINYSSLENKINKNIKISKEFLKNSIRS